MNWVDAILILIVLSAVLSGWYKGFIIGTLNLINFVGSILLGFLFYPYMAAFLAKLFTSLGIWKLPLAFIITVILARILIGLVTGAIALGVPASTNNSALNKFLGIIPGLIKGIIYAAVIAALLLALPLKDGINAATRNSVIAGKFSATIESVDEKLSPVLNKAIKHTINNLTIHPKSNESVSLPFKDANPDVRSGP